MTVDLSENLMDALRKLAAGQGRDVEVLLEEAIREYLEATAITDLDQADIAAAQLELAKELDPLDCHASGQTESGDATG